MERHDDRRLGRHAALPDVSDPPAVGRGAGLAGPLALVAAVAAFIIVPFLLFGPWLEARALARLDSVGAAGAALWSVALLALDVLLPVPSSLVALGAGALLGGALGAAVIWVGMSLGCLLGYWVGHAAQSTAQRIGGQAGSRALGGFMRRWGWLGLVVLRPVPVLAEGSLLLASACGLSLGATLAATLPANLIVAIVYAWAGARFAGEAPLWLLVVLTLGATIAVIPMRRRSEEND